MSEWKEYRFDEVADIVDCEHKTAPTVVKGDFYSVRTTNISRGKIDFDNCNRVDEEVYLQWTKRATPEAGDIILAREAPVGEVGLIKDSYKVCLGQRTVLIKLTSSEINNHYLLYYLVNPVNKNELIEMSGGSVVSHLNMKDIRAYELKIPPLEEQSAIASVLSSLDDKIDLLHRQNKTLEQMAETLFGQWFLPAGRHGVEEAKEDWKEEILADFISVKHGYAFKGEYISVEPTSLILVTPGNFKIGGGFKSDKFKYYTKDYFPSEYIFKADDLIVTMTDLSVDGDTLGYSALVPNNYKNEKYLHNQRVGKIEFKSSISKYFLYYLMKTEDYQWFILSGASGTSIRHTSPTSICSYKFKFPPKNKMDEFENVCSDMQKKIRNNQTQIRTLTALRDTLLPKLMSGEVRVN